MRHHLILFLLKATSQDDPFKAPAHTWGSDQSVSTGCHAKSKVACKHRGILVLHSLDARHRQQIKNARARLRVLVLSLTQNLASQVFVAGLNLLPLKQSSQTFS